MARRRRRCSNSSSASFRPGAASWLRPDSSRRSPSSKTCISRPRRSTGSRAAADLGRELARPSCRSPLHGRRACDAGRDGVLCQRADPARDGAAAPGPTGGDAAHQYPALSIADRLEGRADDACRSRQAAGRFRLAPRARRGGRRHGRACQLHCGLCRHGHHAGREMVRDSHVRHHGALVHPSLRRRNRGVRRFRAIASGEPDVSDRYLRYRGRRPEGRRARAAAQGARDHDPGACGWTAAI